MTLVSAAPGRAVHIRDRSTDASPASLHRLGPIDVPPALFPDASTQEVVVAVLPFYGTAEPERFALERRSIDRPGRVLARLDQRLPRTGSVLDVGAGDGWTARQLAGAGRHVLALEPAVSMARHATAHPAVTWLHGDAGALPLTDGAVDAAYATWAYFFPSIIDPSRGLAELHRVVRPGGPIVIVNNAGDDDVTQLNVASGGEDLDWFTDRGFDIEVVPTAFGFDGEDPDAVRALLSAYVGDPARVPEGPPTHLEHRVAVASTRSTGPPRVRVRGMRRDEAARVGELTLAGYDAYGDIEGDYRTELRDPTRRVDGSTSVLVAEVEGRVAGTVTFVLPHDEGWEGRAEPDGDAMFRVLAVDPTVEGAGAGRALVDACVQRAGELGCRRIIIVSMAWMDRAHRLYERLGFQRRHDLDVRFPAGDGYVFTLDLTADAPEHFAPPGPPVDPRPWYADVWR